MARANSAGVLPTGTMPRSWKRFLMSSLCNALTASACIRSRTARGVPAGATNPNQPTTYTMLLVFTVDGSPAQLDQHALRAEARTWLESRKACVHGVSIRKADE